MLAGCNLQMDALDCADMANAGKPWTLERLIDLEEQLAADATVTLRDREAVAAAIQGHRGAAARRIGFAVWFENHSRESRGAGGRFCGALTLVSAILGVFLAASAISGLLGMVDHQRGGLNVSLYVFIFLAGQWAVLLLGLVGWVFRRRVGTTLSPLQRLFTSLARRWAGKIPEQGGWWQGLMHGGLTVREVLLWRLGGISQAAAMAFNIGLFFGLGGLVLVRNVGFFWESTTASAMGTGWAGMIAWMSAPWAALIPGWVPNMETLRETRWLPGMTEVLPPGPAEWWRFLLASTIVWGFFPRFLLWLLTRWKVRRALRELDFQGKHHRELWREMAGTARIDHSEPPADGALVLDIGGSGISEQALRPFLLQVLRVNPTAWHSMAVLDPGAELQAESAIAAAPSGVVLLAEGWALTPARMTMIHRDLRAKLSDGVPIHFLIANAAPNGTPLPPTATEIIEWKRVIDAIRDPDTEIYFYADDTRMVRGAPSPRRSREAIINDPPVVESTQNPAEPLPTPGEGGP